MALMRFPVFRFRPSQADALHVDLWHAGINVIRDAGTFSYATPEGQWYASVAAHSTAQFGDYDQMPRLGRFLFAKWLQAQKVEMVGDDTGAVAAGAGYRDAMGHEHHRRIELKSPSVLQCVDTLGGDECSVVVRWRLCPADWILTPDGIESKVAAIKIKSKNSVELRLVYSSESTHYLCQTEVPVFEVISTTPVTIVTIIDCL